MSIDYLERSIDNTIPTDALALRASVGSIEISSKPNVVDAYEVPGKHRQHSR